MKVWSIESLFDDYVLFLWTCSSGGDKGKNAMKFIFWGHWRTADGRLSHSKLWMWDSRHLSNVKMVRGCDSEAKLKIITIQFKERIFKLYPTEFWRIEKKTASRMEAWTSPTSVIRMKEGFSERDCLNAWLTKSTLLTAEFLTSAWPLNLPLESNSLANVIPWVPQKWRRWMVSLGGSGWTSIEAISEEGFFIHLYYSCFETGNAGDRKREAGSRSPWYACLAEIYSLGREETEESRISWCVPQGIGFSAGGIRECVQIQDEREFGYWRTKRRRMSRTSDYIFHRYIRPYDDTGSRRDTSCGEEISGQKMGMEAHEIHKES